MQPSQPLVRATPPGFAAVLPLAVAAVTASLVAGCPDRAAPDEGTPPPPPPPGPTVCDPAEPAAVTILPRTSNHEAAQLYADLVGAPLDPALFARWTPLAQVRGFDHMTESRIDAQTLEEQLDTTEAIAALLVQSEPVMSVCPQPVVEPPLCTLHPSYDAVAQFSSAQGQDCWSYLDASGGVLTFDAANQRWVDDDPGLFIWSTGLHPGINVDVVRRWIAPQDGAVTLRGTVADVDAGGGDGIVVSIRAPFGDLWSAVIVNGGAPEAFDLTFNAHRGDAIDIIVQRGATNAWDSTSLSATLDFTPAPPSAGRTWDNCALPVLERVAGRAYRRPLRADELADLKLVFDEVTASAVTANLAAPFVEALQAALQAALLSPQVLYKPELVPGGFDAAEDGFRRASRLALYFRSSFPDDELWELARTGALADEGVLRAQAARLLAVDGARFVDNFAGQWLNFRGLFGAPATPLMTSMRQEGRDVFAAVLREEMAPQSLLAPGFTVVDGALAAHYGLEGVDPAAGPTRVTTDARGGLFAQGHFLTAAMGGSDFKRVIHRGLYVLNRTLCTSVPMLDQATLEEIASSVDAIDPDLPLGERMEMHRTASERCTACHSYMDPLGLALESFDETGRFRDAYPDGSSVENGYDFNGVPMTNADALNTFVRDSELYRRCVAEKLFSYGLYRAPSIPEQCRLDALAVDDATGAPRSLHDLAIEAFLASLYLTETP